MTATSDSNPPDGTGYDALIFDWDGTLVDFPVKFTCSIVPPKFRLKIRAPSGGVHLWSLAPSMRRS